jgi:hypothetical protein
VLEGAFFIPRADLAARFSKLRGLEHRESDNVGATLIGANLKGLWASPYSLPVIARLDRAIQ